jgi:hypothetical protein
MIEHSMCIENSKEQCISEFLPIHILVTQLEDGFNDITFFILILGEDLVLEFFRFGAMDAD